MAGLVSRWLNYNQGHYSREETFSTHTQDKASDASPGGTNPAAVGMFKPPHHLFNLPQEIQDMIFDLAFTPKAAETANAAISHYEWDYKQESKMKSEGAQPATFKYKVDEFMVSKQFFTSAARVYVGQQIWNEKKVQKVWDFGLVRALGEHLCTDSLTVNGEYFSKDIKRMQRLRHLLVDVNDSAFEGAGVTKYPWNERLERSELESLPFTNKLINFTPTLRSVYLMPGFSMYVWDGNQKRLWHENIARLNDIVNEGLQSNLVNIRDVSSSTTTAKLRTGAWHSCSPIYTGSQVCSGCSKGKPWLKLRDIYPTFTNRCPAPRTFESLPRTVEMMRDLVEWYPQRMAEWLFRMTKEIVTLRAKELKLEAEILELRTENMKLQKALEHMEEP